MNSFSKNKTNLLNQNKDVPVVNHGEPSTFLSNKKQFQINEDERDAVVMIQKATIRKGLNQINRSNLKIDYPD